MADNVIAVLGTGIMGAAMARNLLSAGMEVRVWNRSREKAEPLADEGATVADSPAEADDGVWLQTSTVGLEGQEKLAGIANEHGVYYVDAPVLGTKEPAEQGHLIVLASGPEEVREQCEPVFDAIGSQTYWLGPAGAGSSLKLVTNSWIVGLLGALAETVALARAIDVDPARFLEVIEGGPLGLPYAQMKGQMMIEKEFPTSFSANLARKDASLVFDAARAGGLRLPISEAAATHFDETIDAGHGEEDVAAVYQATRPDRRQ